MRLLLGHRRRREQAHGREDEKNLTHDSLQCGQIRLRVFPRAKAESTPLGPRAPSPVVGTLAIRRAVLLRWLDEAKLRTRTTVGMAYPGFCSICAAQAM